MYDTFLEHLRARATLWGIAFESWLVKLLFGQLFLTTFSLPLLLWWGLPFSSLTIVGNIIFNPFIGLFLLLSTLLFFCELAYIPSMPIVWLLEHLTDVWLWCVAQGSRHALIALPRPSGYIMVAIAGCSLWIMYRFSHNQKSGILVFVLFLLMLCVGLRYGARSSLTQRDVPYGARAVTVVAVERHCLLFDMHGLLRAGNSLNSWADFTLKPELVTLWGRVHCDAIILMEPTQARVRAALQLAQKMATPYIVVPDDRFREAIKGYDATAHTFLACAPRALLLACVSEKNGEICSNSVKKLWYTIKKFTHKTRDAYVRKSE